MIIERPPEKKISFWILASSFLCHATAWVQYILRIDSFEVAPFYTRQFSILLSLSLLSSILLPIRKNHLATLSLFLLKVILFFLSGIYFGANIHIELTLLICLIIEACLYFSPPYHLLSSILLIFGAVASQRPTTAWGISLPAPSFPDLAVLAVYSLLVLGLCVWLRWHRDRLDSEVKRSARMDDSILQLTSANIGFQQYAVLAEEHSAARERMRIAREIHDTVGYTFTNLIMMLEAASALSLNHTDELRGLLKRSRSQAQEGLNDTRQAMRALGSAGREDDSALVNIHKLVTIYQQATGVSVQVEYGNTPVSFGGQVDRAIFRAVQESLTNSFRHGKARHVRIILWKGASAVTLSIHDDGAGCDNVQEGMGLNGMRERISQLGGQMQAGDVTDGFQINIQIPLQEGEGSVGEDRGSTGGRSDSLRGEPEDRTRNPHRRHRSSRDRSRRVGSNHPS